MVQRKLPYSVVSCLDWETALNSAKSCNISEELAENLIEEYFIKASDSVSDEIDEIDSASETDEAKDQSVGAARKYERRWDRPREDQKIRLQNEESEEEDD